VKKKLSCLLACYSTQDTVPPYIDMICSSFTKTRAVSHTWQLLQDLINSIQDIHTLRFLRRFFSRCFFRRRTERSHGLVTTGIFNIHQSRPSGRRGSGPSTITYGQASSSDGCQQTVRPWAVRVHRQLSKCQKRKRGAARTKRHPFGRIVERPPREVVAKACVC